MLFDDGMATTVAERASGGKVSLDVKANQALLPARSSIGDGPPDPRNDASAQRRPDETNLVAPLGGRVMRTCARQVSSALLLSVVLISNARAAGIGISVAPDTILSTSSATASPWNVYHTSPTRSALGNRDIEFIWSPLYASQGKPLAPNDTTMNDLDRFAKTLCELPQNPFGFALSDIHLSYEYLNTSGTSYSTQPELPGFIMNISSYGTNDKSHIDAYIYMPWVSLAAPGDSLDWHMKNNRAAWPASVVSANEDTTTGHPSGTALHLNSIMIPGPDTTQVGSTDNNTRWTRSDARANWMFIHEFQHAFNQGGTLTEWRSSAAEAITGELPEAVINDFPFSWSLTNPGVYQAWRSFMTYLAFNFRGIDTTSTGRADDLLWRYSKGSNWGLSDLALRLRNSECAECSLKTYFNGLSASDRLQTLLHNWRVAMYVNNDTLAQDQYGFPPHFGFIPHIDVGAFRDIDGIAGNDSVAVPPDTTLSRAHIGKEVSIGGRRYAYSGSTVVHKAMALSMYGADYWVVHADSTLNSGTKDLVVRIAADGAIRRQFGAFACNADSGRIYATVIGYDGPTDSLRQRNLLYRHPEYAKGVSITRYMDVGDSVGGEFEVALPGFGTTYKAAVVVLSLLPGNLSNWADQDGYNALK